MAAEASADGAVSHRELLEFVETTLFEAGEELDVAAFAATLQRAKPAFLNLLRYKVRQLLHGGDDRSCDTCCALAGPLQRLHDLWWCLQCCAARAVAGGPAAATAACGCPSPARSAASTKHPRSLTACVPPHRRSPMRSRARRCSRASPSPPPAWLCSTPSPTSAKCCCCLKRCSWTRCWRCCACRVRCRRWVLARGAGCSQVVVAMRTQRCARANPACSRPCSPRFPKLSACPCICPSQLLADWRGVGGSWGGHLFRGAPRPADHAVAAAAGAGGGGRGGVQGVALPRAVVRCSRFL